MPKAQLNNRLHPMKQEPIVSENMQPHLVKMYTIVQNGSA
jgi:hypothetical protein